MAFSRIVAVLASGVVAGTLTSCKVERCDRYPSDPSCLSDIGQPPQLQVSPRRIPLQTTPAMINITLRSDPGTPQKITLLQNGKTIDLGTISTASSTISPNLRTQVLPGPATIQVGNQQVAIRLYVTPEFTADVIQRSVSNDLDSAPTSPTALGVTRMGQIIMLGHYGPPQYQGLRNYFLNGKMIDYATVPDLTVYTGSRYSGGGVSGFAVTNAAIYFPYQIVDPVNPTDIRQIMVDTGYKIAEKFFPFSSMSFFTADYSGQLIVALTTDTMTKALAVRMFKSDLTIDSNVSLDHDLNPNNVVSLGAGDFNGDSIADLIVYDISENASIYLGSSTEIKGLKYDLNYSDNLSRIVKLLHPNFAAITVGDLDGDQLSDIAVVDSLGAMAIIINESGGEFNEPIYVAMPNDFSKPSALAIGNVNADALLQSNDLVIANNDTSSKLIGVLVNQATKNWPN